MGTSLCVLDSMCPCLYVSISLCVQGSMWQISCRIDPLWLWFYVSRVLCGPGSMWPLMYKLTLCVVGPMCPGSNVTNALCVHGSMWPQSTCYCIPTQIEKRYLAGQFCQIKRSLAEQFRQIKCSLAEPQYVVEARAKMSLAIMSKILASGCTN